MTGQTRITLITQKDFNSKTGGMLYGLDGIGYKSRKTMAPLGWDWVRGLGGPGGWWTKNKELATDTVAKLRAGGMIVGEHSW